ncbi:hypothetical protein EXN66_Car009030 [Channa argus]|uniref:Ig-like domain-containing protein n=1 Tax=Channa argus TaxID=215402 RepID=A0A6G1PT86_CHAAH|nr:hypothetical protein EXN66_Car009030 [Channa argus]
MPLIFNTGRGRPHCHVRKCTLLFPRGDANSSTSIRHRVENTDNCPRFKMLTRWLTFAAFLAGAANQQRAAIGQGGVSVAPTCKVKGHPEEELTLHCGDGKNAGVVRYWHTPFGELQTPGFYSELDPVFLQHDRSLVITNSSGLHSGLYYCLLQHTRGTTLWPYELLIQEHDEHEQSSGCAIIRFRRDLVPERGKQASPSDEEFAGAVAASVLLTFVLGFSAGAVSRTHVLRCLGAITMRLRSLRQPTDTVARGSEVTMTTMPPMYQASEVGHAWDDNSVNSASMDTTMSSTASSPPAKPQRSFKHKRQEQQETAAYLEGCDTMKEEEQSVEEGRAAGSVEENKAPEMGVDEAKKVKRELRCSSLLEEDAGDQSKMEEDKCSEDGEEKEEGESREEKRECEQESKSKEDGEERREHEEEAGGNEEKEGDEQGDKEDRWREGKDGEKERDEDICGDSELSTETETETGSETQEDTEKQGITERREAAEAALSPPTRRCRVIRLYQYDEDGRRYAHLPDSTHDDLVPSPRQRSVSLSRLHTIMASALAGPLDLRGTGTEAGTGAGTGKEEKEERPHFHMDI